MLPYARKQELESDEIGVIIMAIAGYDPRAAIPFWERMAQASSGSQVPEVLSTHPADNKRIERLQKIMPVALEYYKGSGVQNTTTEPIKTSTTVPVENKNVRTSEEWSF
jgi:predicted Zn-dependent protease